MNKEKPQSAWGMFRELEEKYHDKNTESGNRFLNALRKKTYFEGYTCSIFEVGQWLMVKYREQEALKILTKIKGELEI